MKNILMGGIGGRCPKLVFVYCLVMIKYSAPPLTFVCYAQGAGLFFGVAGFFSYFRLDPAPDENISDNPPPPQKKESATDEQNSGHASHY